MVIPVARDGSGKALWAPVLFTHFDHVYLFFAESVSCLRPAEGDKPPRWAPGGDVRMSRSKDGVTWSLPVTIYTQATKNGMPKLISNPPEIVNDRFVLPFWYAALMGPPLAPPPSPSSNSTGSAGTGASLLATR